MTHYDEAIALSKKLQEDAIHSTVRYVRRLLATHFPDSHGHMVIVCNDPGYCEIHITMVVQAERRMLGIACRMIADAIRDDTQVQKADAVSVGPNGAYVCVAVRE